MISVCSRGAQCGPTWIIRVYLLAVYHNDAAVCWKPCVSSINNGFQDFRYYSTLCKKFMSPAVLIKSPLKRLIMSKMSFSPTRSITFGKRDVQSHWYCMCCYMINIFRANRHTWHQRDVVHYIKKQFTVHVLVRLSVPPCQHDRSLLHTERLWWLEVGAAAEEWCIPHIMQQGCSHRGSWCPHHAMMALSAVWHMICVQTVSTYAGAVVPFDCFMWVTHGVLGRSGGERTFFMQPMKEGKTCPWDVTSCLTTQSYVEPVCDTEPWEKLCSEHVLPFLSCIQ